MKTSGTTTLLLLLSVFVNTAASAQSVRVRHHPDPNLPVVNGSGPGRGIPGQVDPTGPSVKLSEAGDAAQAKSDWGTAKSRYLDAIDLWPDNSSALYGLAKCAVNDGDTEAALGYYRKIVYSHSPNVYGTAPGDGYGTNNVGRMMEFVLVLSQAHQDAEAQKVYKQAAHVLNYQDSQSNGGRPFLKVLLPEFGPAPGQVAYTPQRLQAMAHVTLSILSAGFDGKVEMSEVRKALQLYPDSPVAYYYLGERLYAKSLPGAKAAYQKAAQLSNDQVKAAARDAMKHCR